MTPLRLTIVQTHPVQYMTPWFAHVSAQCPELDLTVVYAARPTAAQQGVGFDTTFTWDRALADGHRSVLVRDEIPGADFGTGRFGGLDVPEMGDAVLDTRPDVVLVPGWHAKALVRAIAACRRRRIPLLYRGDSHLGSQPPGWRGPAWHLKTRSLLQAYSGYLAVGTRSREYLRRHGVRPERIFASPHAVDNAFFAAAAAVHATPSARAAARAAFGCAADEFVCLYAGKLAAGKRVGDLVAAAAALGGSVRLLVAGSGALESHLREEASRLGVPVSWLGFVNQGAMGRVYAAADCLALPSARESWGLVVNEALATGLPVVVSEAAGCAPDLVVPGLSGETYAEGDSTALASALARVRDRGGRASIRDAAATPVARHTFADATTGLLAACQAVRRSTVARPRVVACCGGMVIVAGLERMTFEVLRVVREHGGRVHCIVNDWENHRIVPVAEQLGASWSTGFYGHTFTRRPNGILPVIRMAWDITKTSAGLLRSAVRVRPTHILLPEYMAAIRNLLALPLLRACGATIVLRLGNAPEPQPFYRHLWRWVVNPLVDRFICNSAFTERELLAHGIRPAKVSRIYNTAPPRLQQLSGVIDRDLTRVVYVGQVIPEKGLDVLLDAVGLLASRGVAISLDVVGSVNGWMSPSYEGFREQILARAAQPDLAARVRFLGWREDVGDIMRGAIVHCCPSQPQQREAFGLVTLEAKLAGIPSVVTPFGALPELVSHRHDGWIASGADAAALAEGLEYFLRNPQNAHSAGAAARASAARFDRVRFAQDWREVFA